MCTDITGCMLLHVEADSFTALHYHSAASMLAPLILLSHHQLVTPSSSFRSEASLFVGNPGSPLHVVLSTMPLKTRNAASQVMVCPERGALGSLIHNETVELDNEMVVGIMKDVAMGMKFLHFSKIPTEDEELTPARVLVDSNYRAQLMHFQLHLVCYFAMHSSLSVLLSGGVQSPITLPCIVACLSLWLRLSTSYTHPSLLTPLFPPPPPPPPPPYSHGHTTPFICPCYQVLTC